MPCPYMVFRLFYYSDRIFWGQVHGKGTASLRPYNGFAASGRKQGHPLHILSSASRRGCCSLLLPVMY